MGHDSRSPRPFSPAADPHLASAPGAVRNGGGRTVCSAISRVGTSLSRPSRGWDEARNAALTEEEYESLLARRPYDLRHACVSTWLAAGVPSTQCAEWAGHSVAVLHQIYAKVIAGLEAAARAAGCGETREQIGSGQPDSAGDDRTPNDRDRGHPRR